MLVVVEVRELEHPIKVLVVTVVAAHPTKMRPALMEQTVLAVEAVVVMAAVIVVVVVEME